MGFGLFPMPSNNVTNPLPLFFMRLTIHKFKCCNLEVLHRFVRSAWNTRRKVMLCNVPPNAKEEIRSVSKWERLLKFSRSAPRTLLIAQIPSFLFLHVFKYHITRWNFLSISCEVVMNFVKPHVHGPHWRLYKNCKAHFLVF